MRRRASPRRRRTRRGGCRRSSCGRCTWSSFGQSERVAPSRTARLLPRAGGRTAPCGTGACAMAPHIPWRTRQRKEGTLPAPGARVTHHPMVLLATQGKAPTCTRMRSTDTISSTTTSNSSGRHGSSITARQRCISSSRRLPGISMRPACGRRRRRLRTCTTVWPPCNSSKHSITCRKRIRTHGQILHPQPQLRRLPRPLRLLVSPPPLLDRYQQGLQRREQPRPPPLHSRQPLRQTRPMHPVLPQPSSPQLRSSGPTSGMGPLLPPRSRSLHLSLHPPRPLRRHHPHPCHPTVPLPRSCRQWPPPPLHLHRCISRGRLCQIQGLRSAPTGLASGRRRRMDMRVWRGTCHSGTRKPPWPCSRRQAMRPFSTQGSKTLAT
mmetsp:Transcript_17113/g.51199  ORF Transcript_17113/g.51199 Transcript_17113/m.51199 type:complete len:379 (+) Transcript_17113:1073-2209(+)